MKTASVTIQGVASLLMNRRPMEEEGAAPKVKKKGQPMDHTADAEKKSYFDEKIGYYVPSDMIEGVLREAGKNLKAGRGNLKNTVLAAVFCGEEMVPLGRKDRKDYDKLDQRWTTHPSTKNSVLTSRIRFDKWKLTFTINFDESRIDENTLKALIEEAGIAKGIGSYKPKFGRFKLVEFEVQ